jgi:hypothetical protein
MSRNSIESTGAPERLFHWIPGEMVVVVRLHRRPAADAQDALVEQIRTQLNSLLKQYKLTLEPYGTSNRWQNGQTISPVRRRSFIFGLHRQQPLIAIFFHVRHADSSVRDAVPMALSHLQSKLEQLVQTGLHIVSAMPNWLVTAAPLLYGEGGPASLPRPAPRLTIQTPGNARAGWHISLLDPSIPLDPKQAEEVIVAVLDTAQPRKRLFDAAAQFDNVLLQQLANDLRSDNGSFEIEYDRYPIARDVCTGHDNDGEPRYYSMADHGLFVTGLIRDVAPDARIRLIRVLDDFGGGDLYNLFAALTDLEQELVSGTIRRLVINLSLTIIPDVRRLPYIWFDDRQWPSGQLSRVTRILAHIEEGLRLLFESLYAHGALIVAAAGNDSMLASKQGLPPLPPRAPARYETTLSVTAVNSRFNPSRFANMACMPPLNAGVATFGGDSYGSIDAHRLADAVRGVYISPTFPSGEPNTSSWADWSGTSFATAIISALGAHLMALGWSTPNAIARLATGRERRTDFLFGSRPDVPALLANIIRVQQQFVAQ